MSDVEPWLRGTHTDLDPVRRAVLHALELAGEDIEHWCVSFDSEAMKARPFGLPSVGFQLRHISRSLDRLMTYAEGYSLSAEQLAALQAEHTPTDNDAPECGAAIQRAIERLLNFKPEQLANIRTVGRDKLPTTVVGLLIHIAEHTQRHVGQAITTAKVVSGLRAANPP